MDALLKHYKSPSINNRSSVGQGGEADYIYTICCELEDRHPVRGIQVQRFKILGEDNFQQEDTQYDEFPRMHSVVGGHIAFATPM